MSGNNYASGDNNNNNSSRYNDQGGYRQGQAQPGSPSIAHGNTAIKESAGSHPLSTASLEADLRDLIIKNRDQTDSKSQKQSSYRNSTTNLTSRPPTQPLIQANSHHPGGYSMWSDLFNQHPSQQSNSNNSNNNNSQNYSDRFDPTHISPPPPQHISPGQLPTPNTGPGPGFGSQLQEHQYHQTPSNNYNNDDQTWRQRMKNNMPPTSPRVNMQTIQQQQQLQQQQHLQQLQQQRQQQQQQQQQRYEPQINQRPDFRMDPLLKLRQSRYQRKPAQTPPKQREPIDFAIVSQQVHMEVKKYEIPHDEQDRIDRTMKLLQKVCSSVLPGGKLEPFGSHVSGLATQNADLDLILLHETVEPQPGSPESKVPVLLAAEFLKRGFKVALLTRTRVPILKLTSPKRTPTGETIPEEIELPIISQTDRLNGSLVPLEESIPLEYFEDEDWPEGISCDIGFTYHLGVENSQMVKTYTMCDPRVRTMLLFVKIWAKARQINNPYLGTLSSYGYVLLVLQYLMHIVTPPVLPNLQKIPHGPDVPHEELFSKEGFNIWYWKDRNEIKRLQEKDAITNNRMTVGELLYEFFYHYAWCFDYKGKTVSVRSNRGILNKHEKGWTAAISRHSSETQNSPYTDRYLFAIEDPFEITHNVGRTCTFSGLMNMKNEFKRGCTLISYCHTKRASRNENWMADLMLELTSSEVVKNPHRVRKDYYAHIELLKMIKGGLTVGERDLVSTRPKAEHEDGENNEVEEGFQRSQPEDEAVSNSSAISQSAEATTGAALHEQHEAASR